MTRQYIIVYVILQKFEQATEAVKALTKRPTDEEFLELYALFKQATVGNINTSELLHTCLIHII